MAKRRDRRKPEDREGLETAKEVARRAEQSRSAKGLPAVDPKDIVVHQQQFHAQLEAMFEHSSGPIPGPEMFSRYPVAIQNWLTDRADREQAHRHAIGFREMDFYDKSLAIEAAESKGHGEYQNDGLRYGFWAFLAVLVVGFVFVETGHETSGNILIGFDVVSVIGRLIAGAWRSTAERRAETPSAEAKTAPETPKVNPPLSAPAQAQLPDEMGKPAPPEV